MMMSEIILTQESAVEREIDERRTILSLMREQMESSGVVVDESRTRRERRSSSRIKERLGLFNGWGCCGGAAWGFRPTTISVRDDDHDEQDPPPPPLLQLQDVQQGGQQTNLTIINTAHHQIRDQPPVSNARISSAEQAACPSPTIQTSASSGMNLAAALAAERQLREGSSTPLRISLMRLLEETKNNPEGELEATRSGRGSSSDRVCCVCMAREKGAAFIPCGHTFCRVCSRELWLNRGSCPLCNRSILEILDIF